MAEVAVGDSKINKNATAVPAEIAHTFDRSAFYKGENSGVKLDSRGNKVGGFEVQKIEISRELDTEYRQFIKEYVTGLNKVKDKTVLIGGVQQKILDQPTHVNERELLQRFIGKDGMPDDAKIAEFLRSPQGWVITTQIIEQQNALLLFASGLEEVKDPNGKRHTFPLKDSKIHTGIDQGSVNKWWNSMNQNERVAWAMKMGVGTVTTAAGIAGFALGIDAVNSISAINPNLLSSFTQIATPIISAGIGVAGTLGVAGVGKGIQKLLVALRPGVTLETKRSANALKIIKGDPVEEAYMYQMYGIDVKDFVVTGDRIEIAPGRDLDLGTINPEARVSEIIQNNHRRVRFYNSIGVDSKKLDAVPEQFLLNRTRAESLGTDAQQRINDIIEANGGYVNNRYDDAKIYMKARRQFIGEMMNEIVKKEKETTQKTVEENSQQDKFKVIERGIKERDPKSENSELKKRREEKHTEVINAHTKDNQKLTEEQTAIKTYKDNIEAAEKLRTELRSIINLSSVTPRDYSTLLQALVKINSDPTLTPIDIWVDGKPYHFENLAAKRTKTYKDHDDRVNAYTGKNPGDYRKQSQSQLNDELADINTEVKQLTTIKERVENIKKDIDTQTQQLGDSNEQSKKVQEELKSLPDSFQKLIDIDIKLSAIPKPLVGLTEAVIQGGNSEEIYKKINDAYKASKGTPNEVGWPKEENSEHRIEIEHAIIEAKARVVSPRISIPGPVYDLLTDPTTWRFTEKELFTRSQEDLLDEMSKRVGLYGLTPIAPALALPAIQHAKEVSKERFEARLQSYKDRIEQKEQVIRREKNEISKINYDDELDLLSVAKDLSERQGDIFGLAEGDFKDNPKYTDIAAVSKLKTADTNYSTSEKAAGYPKGYYEIMQMLFAYQSKDDKNRDEYFKRISKVIPPKALAKRMNDSLGLGVTLTGTNADITPVLTALQTKLPNMWRSDVREPFKDLINEYRDKAAAIA